MQTKQENNIRAQNVLKIQKYKEPTSLVCVKDFVLNLVATDLELCIENLVMKRAIRFIFSTLCSVYKYKKILEMQLQHHYFVPLD